MIHRSFSFAGVALLSVLLFAPAACGDGTADPGSQGGRGGSGSAGSAASGAEPSAGDDAGGVPSGEAGGSGTSGTAGASGTSGASGGGGASGGTWSASGASGAGGADGGAGTCGAVEKQEALTEAGHIPDCTPVDYATNPPSSGPHYPTWADFGEYDFALPRGFWVHNLEHGAVVVTYHCEDGCEQDLAAARAWLAGLKPDAGCDANGPARALLIPDPKLDVPWAASAWGYTLRADCFDAAAFSAFYEAHAGQPPAPEASLCGTGFDFRAEGAETCGAK